uniref:LRMP protein n=1 Tax=Zosterops lateralis melanops TaxID=1220523 RepID=A0A8D2NVN0_ZOSLA
SQAECADLREFCQKAQMAQCAARIGSCSLILLYLSQTLVTILWYSSNHHVSVQIYLNFCITWIPLKYFLLPHQAEFLRLSLGFKCDLFTLDKRVKLEERSRDLAEENLKKEITNAVNMLEALVPLCEEDNQAQEIIKKLQKSLQFLSQYAARVASRAEMLGAINQESRVSKAVEVMIQHVENLKRMYAKEHAELEELKQVLLQNERSFSCLGDRALRRVSIATVPRSAGNAGTGVPLVSRSCWRDAEVLGVKQNEKRPSLQRFLSTYSWQQPPPRCALVWFLMSFLCTTSSGLMSAWASHFKASFCNANKTLWVSVSILVLLAALTSFLTGLSLQRPADAAPVGTGDSWTSVQQLLWPYTGLQHHGPPPV